MPETIPDSVDLQHIMHQLLQTNERLAIFTAELERIHDHIHIIKATTQQFSTDHLSSHSHPWLTLNTLPEIKQISTQVTSINAAVNQLEERVHSVFLPVQEAIGAFGEQAEKILSPINQAGEFAETLNETVQNILVDKTETIETEITRLSALREEKLEEGENLLNQHIETVITQLLDALLDEIATEFNQQANVYLNTIDHANDHMENMNQSIEDSIGQISEQLEQVVDVLDKIEPVLKQAEVILA